MNRTQRRLFMWFFICLFALVAPTVVLFAQGYRFNLENNIFIHSGSITVKSWPKDTEIFIDGEKQESKNLNIINGSRTINGVKPGKYKLTCSKPGYLNWEKEIEVHSGISTEFWNVLLFPEKTAPENIPFDSNEKIEQIFLSPNSDKELILFSTSETQRKIQLLNIETSESKIIFETEKFNFIHKEEGLNVEWNTNNKKLIIPVLNEDDQKSYLIIDLDEEEPSKFTILNDFFKNENLHQVRWMFNEENEITVLTKKNNLFSFDYKKGEVQLIAEDVSGFDFAEYSIYFTQLPNNIIWKVKQNDFKNKKQISNEPLLIKENELFTKITAYDEYRIFVNTSVKSFIYNENTKKNLISVLKPSEKISEVQFSDDGKKLLCWNEHEVWYYMLRDWEIQPKRYFGDKITITRSSEIIKNVQWMDNYENIILSTKNTIKTLEVDPRSRTNLADLTIVKETIPEKNLLYNKNNQTLYYLDDNKIFSLLVVNNSGFLGF